MREKIQNDSLPKRKNIPQVCVAIVTYGNRANLLSQVLKAVFGQTEAERIKYIVVCSNGASKDTQDLLVELSTKDSRLHIVALEENRGSEEGYATAIGVALDAGCDYIWCLDDDTEPHPDALEELLKAVGLAGKKAVFLSCREDSPCHIQLLKEGSAKKMFRIYNFLGFSILDIPRKIYFRLFKKFPNDTGKLYSEKLIPIPYAPYGGFFFSSQCLSEVGLPDRDLYLYGDIVFTSRFIEKGYSIYLVPKSRIKDLDYSWYLERTHIRRLYSRRLLVDGEEKNIKKLYYAVRNRVFFETQCLWWNKNFLYLINVITLLLLLLLQAFLMSLEGQRLGWRSFLVITRAVRDGFRSRLGEVDYFDE
jgi:GT2 family glycosyltransferase